MFHKVLYAMLLVFLLSFAQWLPAGHRQQKMKAGIGVPAVPYEKYKLKNGLEVILDENHRLPLVTVYVLYHVGPANERPGLTGFAHLFEHLMFEGSLHVGEKAHFKILEAIGGQQLNATTDLDHTKYFETVPSNELETALWLESDRMGFLLEKLNGSTLANQRDVVRNERRQRIESPPYGLAEIELYHLLFPQGHPYYANVIGSHADIEAARLHDVIDFLKLYYTPNNASIAIVGDIDKRRTKELVEKYFGPLPSGNPVPAIAAATPPISSERRKVMTDKVQLPRIYMAWITDPIFKPGDAEEQMLAHILGGPGKSSRLYRRLVYERQMAQDVMAEQTSLSLGSVFTVQATAKPGIKPEDLEAAMEAEMLELQKNGPTQEEVEGAKNVIEARILHGMETIGGEGGVAGRLSLYNHHVGNPGFLPKDIERYEKVDVQALKTVAQQKFSQHSRVVLYCIPGPKNIDDVPRSKEVEAAPAIAKEREAFDATQAWRSGRPGAGPVPTISLPVPDQFKLANGLTVLLLQRHDLPIVTASLFVLSGNETDPAGKPGLAAFMTKSLEEGTRKRSALQIAFDSERIGAEMIVRSIADWSGISIRVLNQNLDGAFDLLSDIALNPAFPKENVERVRKERITALLQERDNPSQLALRVFYRLAYGDNHPYGHMELGSEDSLQQITREDLLDLWGKGYVPGNAVLSIAGDLTENEARSLALRYFGSWHGQGRAVVAQEFQSSAVGKIALVDKPGAPQTALLVGTIGTPRSSSDYVPLEVMNNALGGLISARLNLNLREKHGYTYSAFSQFVYRRMAGPFFARTSVRTEVTAPALKELFNELTGIRSRPLSPEELRTAKNSMARALPGLFETTQQAARSMGDLFIYGLPLDYYRTLPAQIETVDSMAAQRMAEKYIQSGSMIVVVVGDRSKIEPEMKKMELGPIEIRDGHGNIQLSADH